MLPNAFAGRAKQPTEAALKSVLGDRYPLWRRVIAELNRELRLDALEWHTYSVKAGWSLRLQRKKRNIVYLGPRPGWFLASFALGDKAIAAARKSNLPVRVLEIIAQAPRYAEGTAVRIEVHDEEDAKVVMVLARIKLEH